SVGGQVRRDGRHGARRLALDDLRGDRQRRRRRGHGRARRPPRDDRDHSRGGAVTRRPLLAALALGTALVTTATAAPAPDLRDLEAAHAERLDAARRYRETLETLLPLREEVVARAEADLERRRALAEQQLIARTDVDVAAGALAAAREEAERTRQALREAESVVTEAEA